MKRLIMLLISTVMMSMSLTAADIVTVHGEFTYYGSKTESRADCERNALNGARAKALAGKSAEACRSKVSRPTSRCLTSRP